MPSRFVAITAEVEGQLRPTFILDRQITGADTTDKLNAIVKDIVGYLPKARFSYRVTPVDADLLNVLLKDADKGRRR